MVKVFDFRTFDCVWLAKVLGDLDPGLRLCSVTELSIDHAGTDTRLIRTPVRNGQLSLSWRKAHIIFSRKLTCLIRTMDTSLCLESRTFLYIFKLILRTLGLPGVPGGGVLPYVTYTGMCRPTGSWFWSSWFRTGYPFQRRFLERGIKNCGSRLYLLLQIVADHEEPFIWCISRTNKEISFQKNKAISNYKLSRTQYKKLAHF